ncbi:hypothetical protein AB4277_09140 [Vibrio splendidus]
MRGLVLKELIVKGSANQDSRSVSLEITQAGESLTKGFNVTRRIR